MIWHLMNEKPTNEKAQYLLIIKVGKHNIYRLARYNSNLYKMDKYNFDENDGGGFYISDPEWGYIKMLDVLAWSELPEIPDYFEPKD